MKRATERCRGPACQTPPSLAVSFACTQSASLDTQQLRYRVFVWELGADLPARPWHRS